MSQLKHLLSPIKVGKTELKNRVEFAPVTDADAVEAGFRAALKVLQLTVDKGNLLDIQDSSPYTEPTKKQDLINSILIHDERKLK